ncbi:hypothetical protein IW261DRAFT_1423138 [Armillaria novae-zelandiae]|uniref:Uncharacterized protein n=1 Tax=Armillaria novae-zelandiae TaxID=153914 RepID=A0AA39T9M9_9AGAR|nr:hypothetical protein IW261DRAFT_1423138 [Armillaria novae-zelandiae]
MKAPLGDEYKVHHDHRDIMLTITQWTIIDGGAADYDSESWDFQRCVKGLGSDSEITKILAAVMPKIATEWFFSVTSSDDRPADKNKERSCYWQQNTEETFCIGSGAIKRRKRSSTSTNQGPGKKIERVFTAQVSFSKKYIAVASLQKNDRNVDYCTGEGELGDGVRDTSDQDEAGEKSRSLALVVYVGSCSLRGRPLNNSAEYSSIPESSTTHGLPHRQKSGQVACPPRMERGCSRYLWERRMELRTSGPAWRFPEDKLFGSGRECTLAAPTLKRAKQDKPIIGGAAKRTTSSLLEFLSLAEGAGTGRYNGTGLAAQNLVQKRASPISE